MAENTVVSVDRVTKAPASAIFAGAASSAAASGATGSQRFFLEWGTIAQQAALAMSTTLERPGESTESGA